MQNIDFRNLIISFESYKELKHIVQILKYENFSIVEYLDYPEENVNYTKPNKEYLWFLNTGALKFFRTDYMSTIKREGSSTLKLVDYKEFLKINRTKFKQSKWKAAWKEN